MCTIRVFRGLANQVAPRAGSVLRRRLKVHNSKSGTCQGGVFLVYCMMYFIILIYLIILQLSRGASGKEFFGARTHGFCTHQARPTCKNTGKVNNRSRETGTHGRYCIRTIRCDCEYSQSHVIFCACECSQVLVNACEWGPVNVVIRLVNVCECCDCCYVNVVICL